jgi:predicted transcriptional regulator
MPRPKKDVTDAELAVLEVLWDRRAVTVRQIAETLYEQCNSSEHATVQKLLDRLKAKGCVGRDRSVWPHQFTATIQREDLIGRRLETMAEALCGGSLQPLLTHLVRNTKLSEEERLSLRTLLDELDDEKKRKRDK